jgi:hypothetical protein
MAVTPIIVYATDLNGNVQSGAKLYPYAAGTTTPQATYTDSGLGTPAAHPVVCDSAGRAVVWMDSSLGDYKLILTNSAGSATYFSQDNIDASAITPMMLIYPALLGDQTLNTTDSPTFASVTLGAVPFSGVVTDPGADRIMFWDDSDTQVEWLGLGTGLSITANTLGLDADLVAISGLTPADGAFIVGDSTAFVAESGATARTSLGLAIGTDVLAYDANLQAFATAFTAPTVDGTAGQYIKTDGAGTLSFATPAGGGDVLKAETNLSVDDYTALKALDAGISPSVFVEDAARGGVFVWDAIDLSAAITADTAEGVYVPPTSDATGASGAWVRQVRGPLNILWFGAILYENLTDANSGSDSSTAIQAAIDYASSHENADDRGGEVFIPAGYFKKAATITLDTAGVSLIGEGSTASYLIDTKTTSGPMIRVQASRCALKDFYVRGTTTSFASGQDIGSPAILLQPLDAVNLISGAVIDNVQTHYVRGSGLIINRTSSVVVNQVTHVNVGRHGLVISNLAEGQTTNNNQQTGFITVNDCRTTTSGGHTLLVGAATGAGNNSAYRVTVFNYDGGEALTDATVATEEDAGIFFRGTECSLTGSANAGTGNILPVVLAGRNVVFDRHRFTAADITQELINIQLYESGDNETRGVTIGSCVATGAAAGTFTSCVTITGTPTTSGANDIKIIGGFSILRSGDAIVAAGPAVAGTSLESVNLLVDYNGMVSRNNFTVGRQSGGTYNGNIVTATSDQYPSLTFNAGATRKGQLVSDVNNGDFAAGCDGDFLWRDASTSGSDIMELTNAGALTIGETSGGTYDANITLDASSDRYPAIEIKAGATAVATTTYDVNTGRTFFESDDDFQWKDSPTSGNKILDLSNSGAMSWFDASYVKAMGWDPSAQSNTGGLGLNESSPNYRLDVNGTFGFKPGSSVDPADVGHVVIEATNNTTLTFKLKGSDGNIRTATLTLSL